MASKKVKAVQKEGGKKGIDLQGIQDLGGMNFSVVNVDEPEGDMAYVLMCIDAMNAEVDETAEERRGGAGEMGKMVFSSGLDALVFAAHVPEKLQEQSSAAEWVAAVAAKLGDGAIVCGPQSAGAAQAIIYGDKAKEIFPIKLKDEALKHGFEYLSGKGLVKDSGDSDDDEELVFGDHSFDEWN